MERGREGGLGRGTAKLISCKNFEVRVGLLVFVLHVETGIFFS